MAIDTRTPEERAYDAERDGSAYVKPAENYEETRAAVFRQLDEIVARRASAEPPDQQFGTLADGTPIMAQLNHEGRYGVVSIDTDDWYISADDDGYMAGSAKNGNISFEEWNAAEIATMRALLSAGTLEHLLAVAAAWGRGDAEPPATTPDTVQATPIQADGCTWTDYEIGGILLGKLDAGYYPPDKGPWQLIIHGCEIDAPITFDMLGTLMVDLSRLLADDRVRAAFGESPLMHTP